MFPSLHTYYYDSSIQLELTNLLTQQVRNAFDLFVYEALIYLSITLQCGCDQSLNLLLLAVTIKLLVTQISSSCDDPLSLREIHYQHLIRYPVTGQWFYENGNIISIDSVFFNIDDKSLD